ncbi:16560_t:CDS:2, partial [Entrophospora sp. SA101]
MDIRDSLCTKCYTSKVQWDRNIKYQRHRLNTKIIDLQNEIDNLKNSIDNLKQEMKSITRPSVNKIK